MAVKNFRELAIKTIPPESFTIRPSWGLFGYSIFNLALFGLLAWIVRVLAPVVGPPEKMSFLVTIFFYAFCGLAIYGLLNELWSSLVIFCGFFRSQIHVEGTRIYLTDWLGCRDECEVSDVVGFSGGDFDLVRGMSPGSWGLGRYGTLRYKDRRGNRRTLRMTFSQYDNRLMYMYLKYYHSPAVDYTSKIEEKR